MLRASSFSALAFALSIVAAAACSNACSNLKAADGPDGGDDNVDPGEDEDGGSSEDDGGSSGGSHTDAGKGKDGAPPATDAGPTPPADVECGEPWSKATKTKPECKDRSVTMIDGPIIDPTGISIARTKAGRVGVVFNSELDADSGELHIVTFKPTTATFTPDVLPVGNGQFQHTGLRSRIASRDTDTFDILEHDVDDTVGDVILVSMVGSQPLSTPEPVFSAVSSPSELGLAVDGAGKAFAAVRVSTGTGEARLSAKSRTLGGGFTALPDLITALTLGSGPGVGQVSLFADASDQVHLVFNHAEQSLPYTWPRYHTLAGAAWSDRKTIDNNVPDGVAGYSPRIVASGTTKHAAYFFRKAGQTPPATAELHVATWQLDTDTPSVEILEKLVPSDDLNAPQYRVAMAVDAFGLLHIAAIIPSSGGTGYLEYVRQTIVSGTVKWLTDIVDDDVVSDFSDAWVDITVDAAVRPHIAYRSAVDGNVYYASRYDR